jgi:hypothetical protein
MRRKPSQPTPRAGRSNGYSFENGVLWIRARNFNMNPADVAKLDAMLKEIESLQGVRQVVFDARGNGGGDSSVGTQILRAAVGDLDFDKRDLDRLPRIYTQWRVSDVAIASMGRYLETMSARYGADSDKAKQVEQRRELMKKAKQAGQPWFDEGGAPRLTRADIAQRNGRLTRFKGTVALITDGSCASACLDFADQVRMIPGSVHLGRTTGSDTVYLERGMSKLPSGNLLFMPIKVWRNRVRGDSEALVPDIPLDVDIKDDAAVRAATLKALAARESKA